MWIPEVQLLAGHLAKHLGAEAQKETASALRKPNWAVRNLRLGQCETGDSNENMAIEYGLQ